ncbi:MAG: phospholipase [Myxococcales bacterium]|nr:phospholipase [Myxococcales bacterium]MCB9706571.1 phospholipase [Myxococcales bacterium]
MPRSLDLLHAALVILVVSCSRQPAAPEAPTRAAENAPAHAAAASLSLVESWPRETPLDHPEIPDTAAVWLEMIGAATSTLDLGEFYGASVDGEALDPILAAVEAAGARGVRVRFLCDASFYAKEPAVADRLATMPGVEVRRLDLGEGGGVMHAKYFVVDGREGYLGSANFDWRSLDHIHELGVRIREPSTIAVLAAIFAADWAQAGPGGESAASGIRAPGPATIDYRGAPHSIRAVASPRDRLPDPALWDLPALLALIDGAQATIRIQLLSYRVIGYDGERFTAIDEALRRAAARGVQVEVMVADWNKKAPAIDDLKALVQVPKIAVRMVTIPPASAGFIPYARVIHAKAMVVDGRHTWIGTSNFSGDYFLKSRNVGVIVDGEALAADVSRVFGDLWSSPYAADVDPSVTYEPPQVGPPTPKP